MIRVRKALFHAVDVGYTEDIQGRAYDFLNLIVILINLVVTVMMTFKEMMAAYGGILQQMIARNIDVTKVKKPLWDIDYSDFFHIKENFEFYFEDENGNPPSD